MNFDYAREIELTVLINCSHTRYTAVRIRGRSRILQRGSESRVDLEGKLTLILYLRSRESGGCTRSYGAFDFV